MKGKKEIVENEPTEDYAKGEYTIKENGGKSRDPKRPPSPFDFEMERAKRTLKEMKEYSESPMLQELDPCRDTGDFFKNKNDICVICGLPCKSEINCMECHMPAFSKMRADTVFRGTLASQKKIDE